CCAYWRRGFTPLWQNAVASSCQSCPLHVGLCDKSRIQSTIIRDLVCACLVWCRARRGSRFSRTRRGSPCLVFGFPHYSLVLAACLRGSVVALCAEPPPVSSFGAEPAPPSKPLLAADDFLVVCVWIRRRSELVDTSRPSLN